MNENLTKELVKIARENRNFTVMRRERAINEEERRRNRQAMIAGLCFLGGVAIAKSNGIDIGIDYLQQNMAVLTSWEALGKIVTDMGPGVTTMSFLSAISIVNAYRSHRRLNNLRNERTDFNNSIEYFQEPWDEMSEDTCNKDINEEREENHYVRTR